MVVPILLTFAFLGTNLHNFELKYFQANVPLVISVTSLAIIPKSILSYPSFLTSDYHDEAVFKSYLSLVRSLFPLSFAENTLVTGLIITKILIIYRDIPPSHVRYANRLGRDIIPILIESAAITFTAQLVEALTYKFEYPMFQNLVVILFVRVFFYLLSNAQC